MSSRRWHMAVGVLALLLLGGVSLAAAQPAITVVTTIPVLKDLVEQVGHPHVQVVSLMTGLENEHTYSPKPSDLVTVRRADLLVEVGLGLEVWVASLVKSAGNPRLRVVTTSKGIALIRERDTDDREDAQDRRAGNPHIWLDPENVKIMLRHITDALVGVDAIHAGAYRDNQATYLLRLDRLQTELLTRLKGISDRRIIVYHPAWPYFARRFGLRIVDAIVHQPGSEPSAHHLQSVIKRARQERIKVIVSEPQLNPKFPAMVARETRAQVIVLTPLPGGLPGTETYLDLLRYNVTTLAQALEAS